MGSTDSWELAKMLTVSWKTIRFLTDSWDSLSNFQLRLVNCVWVSSAKISPEKATLCMDIVIKSWRAHNIYSRDQSLLRPIALSSYFHSFKLYQLSAWKSCTRTPYPPPPFPLIQCGLFVPRNVCRQKAHRKKHFLEGRVEEGVWNMLPWLTQCEIKVCRSMSQQLRTRL